MKKIIILPVLALTLLAACSPNQAATQDTSEEVVQNDTLSPSPVTEENTDLASGTSELTELDDQESVEIIVVEAGSFYYKPNEIRIKKGQKVRIELQSVSMMHDFVIDELGVKVPVTQSGEVGIVEFTADTAGSYEYYCSVGNHREQGQVGTLIVEE